MYLTSTSLPLPAALSTSLAFYAYDHFIYTVSRPTIYLTLLYIIGPQPTTLSTPIWSIYLLLLHHCPSIPTWSIYLLFMHQFIMHHYPSTFHTPIWFMYLYYFRFYQLQALYDLYIYTTFVWSYDLCIYILLYIIPTSHALIYLYYFRVIIWFMYLYTTLHHSYFTCIACPSVLTYIQCIYLLSLHATPLWWLSSYQIKVSNHNTTTINWCNPCMHACTTNK